MKSPELIIQILFISLVVVVIVFVVFKELSTNTRITRLLYRNITLIEKLGSLSGTYTHFGKTVRAKDYAITYYSPRDMFDSSFFEIEKNGVRVYHKCFDPYLDVRFYGEIYQDVKKALNDMQSEYLDKRYSINEEYKKTKGETK